MNRYLCFAVHINPDRVSAATTGRDDNKVVEATDYEAAHRIASNHIPLTPGESIAVVFIGRILNEAAYDELYLGQASE